VDPEALIDLLESKAEHWRNRPEDYSTAVYVALKELATVLRERREAEQSQRPSIGL
jgi:hypothetical protein